MEDEEEAERGDATENNVEDHIYHIVQVTRFEQFDLLSQRNLLLFFIKMLNSVVTISHFKII